MLEIHKQQYKALKTIRSIVQWELIKVGWIGHRTLIGLYQVGLENGYSEELVNEIIQDMMGELNFSLN